MSTETGTSNARSNEEWLERLAGDLGGRPMSSREMGQVLKLARDVAHGVERKLAPLAAFLAGVHVGRRTAEGALPDEALAEAVRAAAAIIPAHPGADTPDSSPGGE